MRSRNIFSARASRLAPGAGTRRGKRGRRAWRAAWLLALVAASPVGAQTVRLTVVDPRPFGYMVGDLLERRLSVDGAAPLTLARQSLPVPGRVDSWLELRQVEASDAGESVEVRLVYQLLNSPVEPATLSLPRVRLHIESEGRRYDPEAGEAEFAASPLLPPAAVGSAADRPRADLPPMPMDSGWRRARLAGYGALATLLAAALAWPLLPRRRAGPFARAYRELRRLPRPFDSPTRRAALRILHRAFDETAGHALLESDLAAFLRAHPHFVGGPADEFFTLSRQEFFGGAAPGADPGRLLALGRELRARERR